MDGSGATIVALDHRMLIHTRRLLSVVLVVGAFGCVESPVLPAVGAPGRERWVPYVLIAGQSNAVFVEPYLSAAFPPVLTVAAPGTAIDAWKLPDGPMWGPTETALTRGGVDAVVWWQGESDWQTPNYLRELRDLIGRMRAVTHLPALPVVIVRVLNRPRFAAVRRAQEEFVTTDPHAALVSTDGLGLAATDHLTQSGYAIAAQRIREAIREIRRTHR